MAELNENNDLNKYNMGESRAIVLPVDVVLSEAVSYNDALEAYTSGGTDYVRKATGAAGSRYVGVCDAAGGQASGERPIIRRGHAIKMTIAAGSAAISPEDAVLAATSTTCSKVAQVGGTYPFDSNVFGRAEESGVAGDSIYVRVEPILYQ